MLVWTTDRIYREYYTDPMNSERKAVAVFCTCVLCGPVECNVPLVRFDTTEERQPDGYPNVGICSACIIRAQHAVDHQTAELGMVRIGSPYDCTHCGDRSAPVVWFNTAAVQEQYICVLCLTEAQKQIRAEQEDSQE